MYPVLTARPGTCLPAGTRRSISSSRSRRRVEARSGSTGVTEGALEQGSRVKPRRSHQTFADLRARSYAEILAGSAEKPEMSQASP